MTKQCIYLLIKAREGILQVAVTLIPLRRILQRMKLVEARQTVLLKRTASKYWRGSS